MIFLPNIPTIRDSLELANAPERFGDWNLASAELEHLLILTLRNTDI